MSYQILKKYVSVCTVLVLSFTNHFGSLKTVFLDIIACIVVYYRLCGVYNTYILLDG